MAQERRAGRWQGGVAGSGFVPLCLGGLCWQKGCLGIFCSQWLGLRRPQGKGASTAHMSTCPLCLLSQAAWRGRPRPWKHLAGAVRAGLLGVRSTVRRGAHDLPARGFSRAGQGWAGCPGLRPGCIVSVHLYQSACGQLWPHLLPVVLAGTAQGPRAGTACCRLWSLGSISWASFCPPSLP